MLLPHPVSTNACNKWSRELDDLLLQRGAELLIPNMLRIELSSSWWKSILGKKDFSSRLHQTNSQKSRSAIVELNATYLDTWTETYPPNWVLEGSIWALQALMLVLSRRTWGYYAVHDRHLRRWHIWFWYSPCSLVGKHRCITEFRKAQGADQGTNLKACARAVHTIQDL